MFEPLKKFVGTELEPELMENINVKQKGDMFLYNYNDKFLVPRHHPIIMKCRGLVLREDGVVLNYPFNRFFNPHEMESIVLDWKTANIQEKFDGSLICHFWVKDHWEITTRGSFYPNDYAGAEFDVWFKELFTGFDLLDKNICYMFELITDRNKIVTWYDESFVVLIGARNLRTLQELSQTELDSIAETLNVRRPKKYNMRNLEECKALFKTLREDEEGLVAVDKNFNRLKIKQDTYLQLSKIKMLNNDDILDYVRGKTELDGELLQKDQKVLSRVEEIREEWAELQRFIEQTFNELKTLPTRKEFALHALKFPFKGFLFYMLDNKPTRTVRLIYSDMQRWIGELPQ